MVYCRYSQDTVSMLPKQTSICGFSFGKNLVTLNYPVVESVRSILPICDRFIFAVGKSEDGTRERVQSIDQRVEIVDTEWPDVKVDGTVLSIEANKALNAAEATGCDWGFYIQADEVVHEADLPQIQESCDRWFENEQVKALLFWYHHFVLDYQTTDPWMYHTASRIVRLDASCRIVADACGPALQGYTGNVGKGDGYLNKHFLGSHVQWANGPARIFHYGWVKTPAQLDEKLEMVENLWWGTLDPQEKERRKKNWYIQRDGGLIERYPILKNFKGTHPAVMAKRIASHPPYSSRKRNRWLEPRFYAEVLRHGFHG